LGKLGEVRRLSCLPPKLLAANCPSKIVEEMTFANATAWDGLPCLLTGLVMIWLGFRRIPQRIAADPRKLQTHQKWRELYRLVGPGLSAVSLLYILAKATI
jgi:hypothetical protein